MLARVHSYLRNTAVHSLNSTVSSVQTPRWDKYRKAGPVVSRWESRRNTPNSISWTPKIQDEYTSSYLVPSLVPARSNMKRKVSPIQKYALVTVRAN